MMRLIDADALDAEMYHKSFEVDDGRNVWNSGLWIRYKIFEEALRDAPTVDAVPVIRCKDCRYNISVRNWVHCVLLGGMYGRTTDNYCSLAERKDNDSN